MSGRSHFHATNPPDAWQSVYSRPIREAARVWVRSSPFFSHLRGATARGSGARRADGRIERAAGRSGKGWCAVDGCDVASRAAGPRRAGGRERPGTASTGAEEAKKQGARDTTTPAAGALGRPVPSVPYLMEDDGSPPTALCLHAPCPMAMAPTTCFGAPP
jgi:hypothetical protein